MRVVTSGRVEEVTAAVAALLSSKMMPNRSRDWLCQAQRDLEQAVDSRRAGRHEWACFAAQQAAEKAVKALHVSLGQEARGPAIARLLSELPAATAPPAELIDKARVLDTYYIPPRYPNSHSEGAPFEHYGSLQSEQALRYAGEIVEYARDLAVRNGSG